MTTPLRYYDWEVLPRHPGKNYAKPDVLNVLPPALYEEALPYSSPLARISMYNLVAYRVDPMAYWRSTSLVLGYMGSVTLY